MAAIALLGVMASCADNEPATRVAAERATRDTSVVAPTDPPTASAADSCTDGERRKVGEGWEACSDPRWVPETAASVADSTTTTAVTVAPPTTGLVMYADPGQEPRALPAMIEGYTPYETTKSETLSVGEGAELQYPATYTGFWNKCDLGMWTARWRTSLPGSLVHAFVTPWSLLEMGDKMYDSSTHGPVTSGASAGYLTGDGCHVPAFIFAGGTGGNVTEVLLEWQLYNASVSTSGEPEAAPPAATAPPQSSTGCRSYVFRDRLPLQLCNEGSAVRWIQLLLDDRNYQVDIDGCFGPGTERAVKQYQNAAGLVPDGVVGEQTWRALTAGIDLPGYDLNGDGMVSPDEIVYH